MRSRLGIPDGKDVLSEVKTYDPERKSTAMAIIDEIEGNLEHEYSLFFLSRRGKTKVRIAGRSTQADRVPRK
jgi:hypothetical protein